MKAEQNSCEEWFKVSLWRDFGYRISLWTFFTSLTFYLASNKEKFSFTKNLKDVIENNMQSLNTLGTWALVLMTLAWLTKDIESTNTSEWKYSFSGRLFSFHRKLIGDILLWLCAACNTMLLVVLFSFSYAIYKHPLPNLGTAIKAIMIIITIASLEAIMIFFYFITKKEGGILAGHIKRRRKIISLHLIFTLFVFYLVNSN